MFKSIFDIRDLNDDLGRSEFVDGMVVINLNEVVQIPDVNLFEFLECMSVVCVRLNMQVEGCTAIEFESYNEFIIDHRENNISMYFDGVDESKYGHVCELKADHFYAEYFNILSMVMEFRKSPIVLRSTSRLPYEYLIGDYVTCRPY